MIRTNFDRSEMRRDRRYARPTFEVVLAGTRYRSVNWSLGGLLLEGTYGSAEPGARVRGSLAVVGSGDTMPFAAAVVRNDPRSGQCAFRFENIGFAGIDFLDRALSHRLHQQRPAA